MGERQEGGAPERRLAQQLQRRRAVRMQTELGGRCVPRPGAHHSWGGHGEPDAAAGVVLEAARPQAAQGRVVGGAALLLGPGLGPG